MVPRASTCKTTAIRCISATFGWSKRNNCVKMFIGPGQSRYYEHPAEHSVSVRNMARPIPFALILFVGPAFGPPLAADDDAVFTPQKKAHWAWKTPVRPNAPAVKKSSWPTNDIDRFVLARLEEHGLTPAPAADPATLVRRLYFDLIGLPPTPAQVDAFVQNCNLSSLDLANQSKIANQKSKMASAVERLVDQLLASPHYGERWGRHWLDLARYAESNGYEFDEIRPDA